VVAVGNEAVQALDRALDTWSQQRRGLWEQALRRTADVHDMFLNDGAALAVERRADGKLTVHTGRRRITIARELGIRTLPGQVIG
jgi:hypothetical protein